MKRNKIITWLRGEFFLRRILTVTGLVLVWLAGSCSICWSWSVINQTDLNPAELMANRVVGVAAAYPDEIKLLAEAENLRDRILPGFQPEAGSRFRSGGKTGAACNLAKDKDIETGIKTLGECGMDHFYQFNLDYADGMAARYHFLPQRGNLAEFPDAGFDINFALEFEVSGQEVNNLLKYGLSAYGGYFLVTAVAPFRIYNYDLSYYTDKYSPERFTADNLSQDRVVLVEEMRESAVKRFDFIKNARESLDITYYQIYNDNSGMIFYALLLEAAERGVEIRLLIDGLGPFFSQKRQEILLLLNRHPGIEVRVYDKPGFFHPWRFNNSMHDKIMIVDREKAMLGGRNIGDRYFDEEYGIFMRTRDRDVVVINTDLSRPESSFLSEVQDYFELVWEYRFSRLPALPASLGKFFPQDRADLLERELQQNLELNRVESPGLFQADIDWIGLSFPTKKVSLIYNSLERAEREPRVWQEITGMINRAEESVLLQSPYIILTDRMKGYLDTEALDEKDFLIITNSLEVTPNIPAFSGYLVHRRRIWGLADELYEFLGEGSVHAKSFIIDGRLSAVGSFNINPRSTYLSTETMVIIDSEEFAAELQEKIDNQIAESRLVDYYHPVYLLERRRSGEETTPLKVLVLRSLSLLSYVFDFLL